jgi:glucosamine-phosphate N-acetyltransferase
MYIRKLEKNDFKNYLKLMNQFRPIDIEINFELFSNIYDHIFKSSEIYIAILNENIIGSVTIIYEKKFINNCALYAHIEDVIVDKEFRNNKIGSKLLDYVKKIAIEKDCFKCTLVCNKNISTFYLKNNFEERGLNMSYLISK